MWAGVTQAAQRMETALPAAGNGNDMQRGWWRIVWCHERCHKREHEGRRQAIRRAVQDVGASLICFKKAKQFSLWTERAPRPHFVLVTDWREAQPCMQSVMQHLGQNQPVLTVVLCESPRQLGRAAEWAHNLPPNLGPVRVHEQTKLPKALLSGLIRQCFGDSDVTSTGAVDMTNDVVKSKMEFSVEQLLRLGNVQAQTPECGFNKGINSLLSSLPCTDHSEVQYPGFSSTSTEAGDRSDHLADSLAGTETPDETPSEEEHTNHHHRAFSKSKVSDSIMKLRFVALQSEQQQQQGLEDQNICQTLWWQPCVMPELGPSAPTQQSKDSKHFWNLPEPAYVWPTHTEFQHMKVIHF